MAGAPTWRRIHQGFWRYRWALVLLAFAVLAWRMASGGREVLVNLEFGLAETVLALPLLAGYFLVFSERSRWFTTLYLGMVPAFLAYTRTLIVSRVFNGLIPQAGNVYRAISMKSEFRLPYRGYVLVLACIASLEVLLLAVVLLALWAVDASAAHQAFGWRAVPDPAVVIALGAATAVLGIAAAQRSLHSTSRPRRGETQEASPSRAFVRTLLKPAAASSAVAQAVAVLTVIASVQWLLFASLGTDLSIVHLLTFVALNRVSQYLTVTPGNLGIRELIYAGAGLATGAGEATAVAASLLLRLLSWLVLGGLLLVIELGAGAGARRSSE